MKDQSIMKIEFYGVYRQSVGIKTIEIELPQSSTIYNALQVVVQQCPILQSEMFNQHGNLYPHQPLYINGRNPRLLVDGLQSVVGPNDVLSIFSPISSGRINVEAVNKVQAVVGQKTVELDIPNNATVRQLVDAIVVRYPLLHDKLLNNDNNLWGHVHVFINGRDAPFLDLELQTVIKPDDTISIFPAVGGG